MDLKYILYVVPGEQHSDMALSFVTWGPNRLSKDKLICYRNPFHLRSSQPPWLNGVPILVDKTTKDIFKGTRCIDQLRKLRMTSQDERDGIADFPMADQDNPTQTQLPKDPRDVFVSNTEENNSIVINNNNDTQFQPFPQQPQPQSSQHIILSQNEPQGLPAVSVPTEVLDLLEEPASIPPSTMSAPQSIASSRSAPQSVPPSTMVIPSPLASPGTLQIPTDGSLDKSQLTGS